MQDYQFWALIVAIISVGAFLTVELKKNKKNDVDEAINHESRHTKTEAKVTEVEKAMGEFKLYVATEFAKLHCTMDEIKKILGKL